VKAHTGREICPFTKELRGIRQGNSPKEMAQKVKFIKVGEERVQKRRCGEQEKNGMRKSVWPGM